MDNKPNLKRCPICGGDISVGSCADDVYFTCYKCGANITSLFVKDDLIEIVNAYNKRASDYDSKK